MYSLYDSCLCCCFRNSALGCPQLNCQETGPPFSTAASAHAGDPSLGCLPACHRGETPLWIVCRCCKTQAPGSCAGPQPCSAALLCTHSAATHPNTACLQPGLCPWLQGFIAVTRPKEPARPSHWPLPRNTYLQMERTPSSNQSQEIWAMWLHLVRPIGVEEITDRKSLQIWVSLLKLPVANIWKRQSISPLARQCPPKKFPVEFSSYGVESASD